MRVGQRDYRFRPRPLPTAAALVLLPLLVGLGLWQLDRADQKRAIIADVRRAATAPVERLEPPLPPLEDVRRRRVIVEGYFDGDHQYLLDNQVRDGRAGYRILTPLRLVGSRAAVLVDRGWRPVGDDRGTLPSIPAPDGLQRVEGVVTRGPSVGLRMGEAYAGDGGWPRRVIYLDFDAMDRALDYRLAGLVVEPGAAVAARAGQAPGGVGPERHIGYAVQWFALAGALLVIFIVVNLERRSAHERGDT